MKGIWAKQPEVSLMTVNLFQSTSSDRPHLAAEVISIQTSGGGS